MSADVVEKLMIQFGSIASEFRAEVKSQAYWDDLILMPVYNLSQGASLSEVTAKVYRLRVDLLHSMWSHNMAQRSEDLRIKNELRLHEAVNTWVKILSEAPPGFEDLEPLFDKYVLNNG
jgi:hypothetical protein